MNFFEQQDITRKKTMKLLFIFGLGVLGIVLAVYAAATLVFYCSAMESGNQRFNWFEPERFLWIIVATLMVITGGSLAKIRALRQGGRYVAESMGGRLVEPSTSDTRERRLVNVVEEMAIASGISVPMVYVMDNESGINAFAAGFGIDDAVVAVTRGTLEQLDRDELQGVIAHEFSHIVNGDMRLNIRLMGLISGILILAVMGRLILRSVRRSRKSKGSGPVLMMGMALVLIGYIGVFFSRIIQSAVSRQREYLADSSAVQFTRNPSGIANALKIIGGFSPGTIVNSPLSVETGHMFFGNAYKSFFETHPPIIDRIRAIEPTFSGDFSDRTPLKTSFTGDGVPLVSVDRFGMGSFLSPKMIINRVGTVSTENIICSAKTLEVLPPQVRDDLRDPFGASCVIYAMLLDADRREKNKQIAALKPIASKEIMQRVVRLNKTVGDLAPELKLPVLDLAIPALRRLSLIQYTRFKEHVAALVESDGKIMLFEFIIQQIITHRLDAAFYPGKGKELYRSIEPLMDDAAMIISKLAILGHGNPAKVQKAFAEAMKQIPFSYVCGNFQHLKDTSFEDVGRAISKFASARPGVKRALLDACACCVLYDHVVTIAEAELLRAVAYCIDLPLPPFPEMN